MLIKFMVGIISQHIHIPDHHVVHLIQYSYSNYISVKLVGGGERHTKRENLQVSGRQRNFSHHFIK